MTTIFDISLPITESIVSWPTNCRTSITQPRHLDRGDRATVSELCFSAHTGTHVDAPAHFIPGGSGVESLDLNLLTGPALVVDTGAAKEISAQVLENLSIPDGTERLIFRTRNSERWAQNLEEFFEDYVAVAPDGADWLVDRGVRLVGVDSLSVAPFDQIVETHRILLSAGVIVVEGLTLHRIKPGMYQLLCLPLKLVGVDGAPARAILIQRNDDP